MISGRNNWYMKEPPGSYWGVHHLQDRRRPGLFPGEPGNDHLGYGLQGIKNSHTLNGDGFK